MKTIEEIVDVLNLIVRVVNRHKKDMREDEPELLPETWEELVEKAREDII